MTTPPRTAAATAARRTATDAKVGRIEAAIKQMIRDKNPISVASVARRAAVSRTFLYQNAKARALVAAVIPVEGHRRISATADEQQETWRERALNAETHIKRLTDELHLQRARIGELMGQVRDLEADLPADAVERLRQDNRSLRQEAGELTRDNRRLHERLTAARDNNRFLDKRLADLEAQLLAVSIPSCAPTPPHLLDAARPSRQ